MEMFGQSLDPDGGHNHRAIELQNSSCSNVRGRSHVLLCPLSGLVAVGLDVGSYHRRAGTLPVAVSWSRAKN